jgi:hypothetical protein
MLIVAMDSNFRLQSRLRGSMLKYPSLAPGWAYFMDDSPYADFIKDYVDDKEVSAVLVHLADIALTSN